MSTVRQKSLAPDSFLGGGMLEHDRFGQHVVGTVDESVALLGVLVILEGYWRACFRVD